MFLWLPLAVAVAVARAIVFLSLPWVICTPILAFLGIHCRVATPSPPKPDESRKSHGQGGQLYVCNHRTLFDPLCISGTLKRHVTATTYSVSRVSEFLSPVKTIRLSRNREADKAMMESVLRELGDLAVCPEGTTCREPYLLRFSPLFAEVSREVVPVALQVHVGMFYANTASGFKGLDPLYFAMNPFPSYVMEFMEKMPTGSIDGKECSSREVANYVQEKMGKVLGFECTALTRRDKYLILAGNEGIIDSEAKGI